MITQAMREKAIGSSCEICGTTLNRKNANVDHIIPKSLGGSSEPSNLRYVCQSCNFLGVARKTASVLATASNLGGTAAQAWLQLFQLAPKVTGAITSIIAVVLSIAVVLLDKQIPDQTPSYAEQLARLEQTQTSLNQLSRFVEQQRESIISEQKAISRLRNEQLRLRPIVEADKKTVDALLAEQQARSDASQARERWIGLGIGIFGSIVFSALSYLANRAIRRYLKKRAGESLVG